ncbi:MAG: hypothetical protein ACKVQR_20945 [Aquabacterium sp.]
MHSTTRTTVSHPTWRAAGVTVVLASALGLGAVQIPARAQTPAIPPLQPLSLASVAAELQQPVGGAMPQLATRGALDLAGRRFYIAEYQVLVEVSGEFPVPVVDGLVLGQPVWGDRVRLQYRATHDVAAIQALVDRSWEDLRRRLADAGVAPADPAETIARHGAILEAATQPTTADAPLLVEADAGERVRRYLVFAPSGQKVVARSPVGINLGNLAARLAFLASRVEGVSLALAVNLAGTEEIAQRKSGFARPADAPPLWRPLSPQLEVRAAPGLALLATHGAQAQVTLTDAVVLDGDFARLRPSAEGTAPGAAADPLGQLRTLGGRLLGARPADASLAAQLELDGPATARLMLAGLSAVNETIVQALRRATAAR